MIEELISAFLVTGLFIGGLYGSIFLVCAIYPTDHIGGYIIGGSLVLLNCAYICMLISTWRRVFNKN